MDLQKMMPSLDVEGLIDLLMEGRWQVQHGSIERFPEFLRPDAGALSNIRYLENWPRFHVAYRDSAGEYRQTEGDGDSALVHYDKGALIHSRSIEEVSDSAKAWLGEWAETLGVSRDHLRLNSWAVKGASGIDWHFDYEDVIHFQIRGDKLFKLLRTPHTRFADKQTKIFERILAAEQNFGEASEQIVREGTITIIPRGVWHWSEGKSDESFAVSLCITPSSCAQILSHALQKRLRLMERNRMPPVGPPASQYDAMEACVKDAVSCLQAINVKSVLLEECRLKFTAEDIGSFYFYLGNRANARLEPMRLFVDGTQLKVRGGEEVKTVLRAVCKIGHGFRVGHLRELVPHVDASMVNEILALLVRRGFLDFVDDNPESVIGPRV
jgi:Cupin superfamily protein